MLSNKNDYSNRHYKKNDGTPVYMTSAQTSFNKSNDEKFSTSEAVKNFGKGLISPITAMFSSKKNFLIGSGMILGSIALIASTGGAAAPLLIAAGLGIGAIQASEAAYKIIKSKNGDDTEKAFFEIGCATSTIGLSLIGVKSSLKQANIETDGLGLWKSTQKCLYSFKNIAKECIDVFKSGYYKKNFSNTLKHITQPRILIKYSKDFYKQSQNSLDESLKVINDILPEEFRPYLKARVKSELSIYEKLVRIITNKFKNQNNQIKLIKTNPEFAKEVLHDLTGIRLTLDDVSPKNIDKLVLALIDAINKGDIKILKIKNYTGVNENYIGKNTPYLSNAQIRKILDISPHTKIYLGEKESGYTATQLKIKPKHGDIFEFQIRGKHIDAFADIEHIPYDLRRNKDIAKGNNQAGIILTKTQKAIKSLSEEQYQKYQEYLYQNYIYAQAKELGRNAIKPELPKEIDPSLSVESLHELHKATKKLPSIAVKNPITILCQLPITAGIETHLEKA